MMRKNFWCWIAFFSFILAVTGTLPSQTAPGFELKFDHNHTYAEVVSYLNWVTKTYPKITKLLVIGKSFQGKDLLVLEITSQSIGKALGKPGYWIDGNLHAGEVMGAEVCLKTIDTLVTQYGKDPFTTGLVDTRTTYIMPKFNPDGSDHFLTKPDGMRSSVRPHDTDGDGLLDEDPPEDLDGDGYITQIRVRDGLGPMKTSPDDPRLLVACKEDEKGEWRVYSEGTDNDRDGRYNEDGVGGLDINRNWPAQWQQEHVQSGAGVYPLSEPETKAVSEFLLSHRNITGLINHHMAGNFVYRPPCNRHFNPVTGEEEKFSLEDESIYRVFGDKYTEIINKQPVRVVYGRGNPPAYGAIWGVLIEWAYDHYGVFSWVPEMGSLNHLCDYDKSGNVTPQEQLRWNDTDMGGKVFVNWKPYNHPQLGKVEIGGFISKIYLPAFKGYTHLMCYPSPVFDDFLAKHAEWNLYLVSMSPLVRITDVKAIPGEAGYFKVQASIQNQGYLPTNVTQQAVRNQTARTVKVGISLKGATLESGKEEVDIGHLAGDRSLPVTVEWMIKASGQKAAEAVVRVTSEKGGTDTKTLTVPK